MTATIATLQLLLLLVGVLVAVAVVAQRLRIAPPIMMVIAGIAMALVPALPVFELSPEFVLLFVLPPVIYAAGVQMSWREFRFNLRPIGMLAIGSVVFTTCAIAAATHYLLGLGWALGFVLGAILAPPDAVAPLAIARELGVPRRIVVVLEGEGLANDATALVIYRFAVGAVLAGAFSLPTAIATFVVILVGEVIYGVLIGWLSLRLRRWVHNTRVEIVLSLMTPYIAFWPCARLGGSGVLATVAAGLYVSWNGPLQISAATRLQGIFFWDLIIYLISGLVFLFTGLQLGTLLETLHPEALNWMIMVTAIATVIAIAARFIWSFPATYLPRWLSKKIAARDPSPPWQAPFVIAYTGIRGVVSLAAALALPLSIPHRDMFLFVAFGVIVVTLIGQGLTLPALIRHLGLSRNAEEERRGELEQERAARDHVVERSARRLDDLANERELPDDIVSEVRTRLLSRRPTESDLGDERHPLERSAESLRIELIAEERQLLHRLLREGKLTDESRRRLERDLDLEEETLRHDLDVVL